MLKKLSSFALVLSTMLSGVTTPVHAASVILKDDDPVSTIIDVDESEETKEMTNETELVDEEPDVPATGVLSVFTTDADENSLSGVTYYVTDEEGAINASWTSDGDVYEVPLNEGEYMLVEQSVPENYSAIGSESFVITSGVITNITRKYVSAGTSFIGDTMNDGVISVGDVYEEQSKNNHDSVDVSVEEDDDSLNTPVNMKKPSMLMSKGPFGNLRGNGSSTTIVNGITFNEKLKHLAGNHVTYQGGDNMVVAFERSAEAPQITISPNDYGDISASQDASVVAWFENGTVKWYSAADTVYLNENARYMFYKFWSLANLSLEGINSSKTTDMGYMFCECGSLTSIDLSSFDTSSAINMFYMFDGCTALSSLDLSSFDTSATTSMCAMFKSCTSLKYLNLSSFDTSNVTDMGSMMYECPLETLILSDRMGGNSGSRFSTVELNYNTAYKHVLDKSGQPIEDDFYCSSDKMMNSLTEAELAGTWELAPMFKVAAYTNWISNLVGGDTNVLSFERSFSLPDFGITPVDVSLAGDNSIIAWSEDGHVKWYSDFKTVLMPKNSSGFFYNMTALSSVDFSGINTSVVTDMGRMFCNCTSLREIDFSQFDTSSVTNMRYMLSQGTGTYPNSRDFDKFVFSDKMGGKDGTVFNTVSLNGTYIHTLDANGNPTGDSRLYYGYQLVAITPASNLAGTWEAPVIFTSGQIVTQEIKNLAGTTGGYTVNDYNIKNFIRSAFAPVSGTTTVSLASSGRIDAWFDDSTGTVYWYSPSKTVYTGKGDSDGRYFFYGLKSINTIDLTGFDTSLSSNLSDWFNGSNPVKLILSDRMGGSDHTKFRNVWIRQGYFMHTKDSSGNPTEDAKIYSYNEFTSSSEQNLGGTWEGLVTTGGANSFNKKLKQLAGNSGANYDTVDTNIKTVVRSLEKPPVGTTTGDIYVLGNESVIAWFEPESGTIKWYSDAETVYFVDGYSAFMEMQGLAILDLDQFDTSLNKSTCNMFNGCSNLKSLNMANFDTSAVTNMNQMFFNAKVQKVIFSDNMGGNNGARFSNSYFGGSWSHLVYYKHTFDLSGEPTGDSTIYEDTNVRTTTPISVIAGTWELVPVLNSGYNVNSALKRLINISADSSTVDSSITSFQRAENPPENGITTTDISLANNRSIIAWFDSSNGTVYWYSDAQEILMNTSSDGFFSKMSALTDIDFSGISTSLVTGMGSMFEGCLSLTELDISSFDMANVTSVGAMFAISTSGSSGSIPLKKLILPENMLFTNTCLTGKYVHTKNSSGEDTGDLTVYEAYSDMQGMTSSQLAGTWERPVIMKGGGDLGRCLRKISGGDQQTGNTDDTIKAYLRSETPPPVGTVTEDISFDNSESIVAWFDDNTGTIYWYSDAKIVYMNEDSGYIFSNNAALDTVDLTGVVTTQTTNMDGIFNYCGSIHTIILSDYVGGADGTLFTTVEIPSYKKFRHTLDSSGNPTGDDTVYSASEFMNTPESVLGGTWEAVSYTITYDGGENSSNVPLPQKKDPYRSVFLSSQIPVKTSSTVSGEITFAGDYDAVDTATATYDTIVSYAFEHWIGNDNIYDPGDTYSEDADVTMAAQYTTSGTGTPIVLPGATKEGMALAGWYTQADGQGTFVGKAGTSYYPDGTVTTLYAFFTAPSKDLTITSSVEGNLASKAKQFSFWVALDDGTNAPVDLSGIEYWKNGVQQTVVTDDGDIVVTIAHGDTVVLKNVPAGVIWTVTEADYSAEGYTTTYTVAPGTPQSGRVATGILDDDTTVSFSNHKSTAVPTEIRTDLPWVGLSVAGLALLGIALYYIRKKKADIATNCD